MQPKKSRFTRQAATVPIDVDDMALSADYDDMIYSNPIGLTVDGSSQGRKRSFAADVLSPKILKEVEIHKLMDVNREVAQSVAIPPGNNGYKLLQKFGYCPSQGGLGKLNTGLAVPIAITKRTANDRGGLGVAEQKRKVADEKVKKEIIHVKVREDIVSNFKSGIAYHQQELSSAKQLRNASSVIYELDFRSGVNENYLWPADTSQENSLETLDMNATGHYEAGSSITIQLDESILYLKEKYNYCLYCGFQYDCAEEFRKGCPGPSESDH